MKKTYMTVALLGLFSAPALATWDVTTPAGTESKSLGDDRIRELKTDVQTALNYEGSFPSTDTANPSFIYTPSSGTTANRPTGAFAPAGRIYINVSSGCIEQYSGTSWNCIAVIISSGVGPTQISTSIAGNAIIGGGGFPLDVNVDSNTITIENDILKVKNNGITKNQIATNTITSSQITAQTITQVEISTFPKFLAYSDAIQTNVTGDGTTATVTFANESYDTNSTFNGSTFTAPTTGFYSFIAVVDVDDLETASASALSMKFVTNNGTLLNVYRADATGTLPEEYTFKFISTLRLTVGDTVRIDIQASNGIKSVDFGGTATTSYFSGQMIP